MKTQFFFQTIDIYQVWKYHSTVISFRRKVFARGEHQLIHSWFEIITENTYFISQLYEYRNEFFFIIGYLIYAFSTQFCQMLLANYLFIFGYCIKNYWLAVLYSRQRLLNTLRVYIFYNFFSSIKSKLFGLVSLHCNNMPYLVFSFYSKY